MNLKNPLHFTFKQKFANLGIFIVNYIINYTFNVFLTRHYTPKIYGDITVTIMALWLVVPFVLQGSNLSSIRFLPEYLSTRQINKFHGFQHGQPKFSFSPVALLALQASFLSWASPF